MQNPEIPIEAPPAIELPPADWDQDEWDMSPLRDVRESDEIWPWPASGLTLERNT